MLLTPIPDPAMLDHLAVQLQSVAAGVRAAITHLHQADGVSWQSAAADRYRARLQETAGWVGDTATAVDDAVRHVQALAGQMHMAATMSVAAGVTLNAGRHAGQVVAAVLPG